MLFGFHDYIKKANCFLNFSGLIEYDAKIILDSAPPESADFNKQLLDFISHAKDEIKNVTLGTK